MPFWRVAAKSLFLNDLRLPSKLALGVQMFKVPACLGLIIGVQVDDAIR